MRKRIRKISVRKRIVWVSGLTSILFFLLTAPVIAWVSSLVSPPNDLVNLRVLASRSSINLTWDKINEIDVNSLAIDFIDQSFELDSSESSFSKPVDGEIPKKITIKIKDRFGYENTMVIDLNEFSDLDLVDQTFNKSELESRANFIVLSRGMLIGVIIFVGTSFVLGFHFSSLETTVLSFYPSIVIIPYLFLTYSFLIAESFEINKLILSVIFSLILYVISYFVILTTNILNTSISVKIPLEQAARASQFIFSLISSYIILVLFFGAAYNFFEKIILIVPPIFYLTFSAILMLENITSKQAIIRSLSITFALIYGIFVLSIWPINYIYSILTIAVCFYILLSVALEIRTKINIYVWIEYGVLGFLIAFLLILNSNWGISGTLI